MSKIAPCLMFRNNDAREAAEFYAATFPDSSVDKVVPTPVDLGSGIAAGGDLVVEFTLMGQAYVGLNGGPPDAPTMAVSFQVYTDNQAETDRYWDAIVADGGEAGACSWCRDRWGFWWQIAPRALMAAIADPDRAAAARAMAAMMTMGRIDIAAIKAAHTGTAA